jgi:hypothetical protein
MLLFCCRGLYAGGPPPTVGTVNIVGEGFSQEGTDFVDVGAVYFLEVNYDGVAPLAINTRLTVDPIDTEIAIFDANGILVAENDDFDFPASLLSELVLPSLPAGQYFLGVGLFNTVWSDGFSWTSSSTDSGNAVVIFETGVAPATENIVNIDLNYNFNGIVHADEDADPIFDPDHPNGFRSISDRALDFRMNIPSNSTVDRYSFVLSGGELDLVHLGNRNTVSGGVWAFDDEADLDGNGIQPDWLPDADQSGRQTTNLSSPIELNNGSQLQMLFNISNGGGSFDVVVGFSDGSEFVATATGPDWFGPFNGQPNIGIFDGALGTDFAFADPLMENTILLTEEIISLGNFDAMTVTSISFENATNLNGAVAVYAVNIAGKASDKKDCLLGDVNQDGVVTLLDVDLFVVQLTLGGFSCEADVNQDGAVTLLDVDPFVEILAGG